MLPWLAGLSQTFFVLDSSRDKFKHQYETLPACHRPVPEHRLRRSVSSAFYRRWPHYPFPFEISWFHYYQFRRWPTRWNYYLLNTTIMQGVVVIKHDIKGCVIFFQILIHSYAVHYTFCWMPLDGEVTRTWSDSGWRLRPSWTWRHGPIKSLRHSPTRVTEFIDWGHGPTNVYSTNPRFPNKFINFLNPSEISQCHILSNLENGATDP